MNIDNQMYMGIAGTWALFFVVGFFVGMTVEAHTDIGVSPKEIERGHEWCEHNDGLDMIKIDNIEKEWGNSTHIVCKNGAKFKVSEIRLNDE